MVELAAEFVPAADEVHHLQHGEDAECRLFRTVAERGHYAGRTEPSDTRQGIYACAPSGEFLGSLNSNDPRRVARMLEHALEAWRELPRERRLAAGDAQLENERLERLETRYPEGGLVLRQFTRDLEREIERRDWRTRAWNQDFAWFTRAEARSLVPAILEPGASVGWPKKLAERLARCHLVDDVRGQVTAFARGAVERVELTSCVTSFEHGRAMLEFSGVSRVHESGHWPVAGFADREAPAEQARGYAAELAGRAVFDVASERFVEFELVAVGLRVGGSQFNARERDLQAAPMGVWFELASDRPEERVAPALYWSY